MLMVIPTTRAFDAECAVRGIRWQPAGPLRERAALVTGAAHGIGLAYARGLATAGARVVLADIDGEGAAAAAKELAEQQAEALDVAVDVADPASVERCRREVRARIGPIWQRDNVALLSVGIDVGSSGTQVNFTRLHLRRLGEDLTGRYFVVARERLYQSPVRLTPYASGNRIDAEALGRIIDEAYHEARKQPDVHADHGQDTGERQRQGPRRLVRGRPLLHRLRPPHPRAARARAHAAFRQRGHRAGAPASPSS